MTAHRILAAATVMIASPAVASMASFQVVNAAGAPLPGAIVTVSMPGTAAPTAAGRYTMAQRNIAYDPHVLIVPVGATVAFPNFDQVRHHVYSFSKAKRFDLKLYGRDESRSVTFDKPGAVTLGCNIHDGMSGLIYVTATPYAAQTDATGHARLSIPTSGKGIVTVWSPTIRAAGNELQKPIVLTPAGISTVIALPR